MVKINSRFATYAWSVLGYNLLVILWGAYVRATGSGAGCGDHWPLCNGQVFPRSSQAEMLVEFTHRVTSGIALLAVVGLLIWALRSYPGRYMVLLGALLSVVGLLVWALHAYRRGHVVLFGALMAMLFMISEALVGAGLVLFKLVAGNESAYRAVAIVVHLVNTFLLLAALALTAWWASGGARPRWRGQGLLGWALAAGLLGVLVVGAAGAITALGDTLFPARSLAEGLQQDFSPTAHFLLQLRVVHPIAAIATGVYVTALAWAIRRHRPEGTAAVFAWALTGLFVIQLLAGALNVALLAPVWMQLIHLLLADLVWISFVLLAASALAQPALDAPEQPSLLLPSRLAEH
jgi:heme A synthase